MSNEAMNKLVAALKDGAGLKDDFIYPMPFDDYQALPDPFPRTKVSVKEVQESIQRYPNPEKPGELFRWDIHGRLFTPAWRSISHRSAFPSWRSRCPATTVASRGRQSPSAARNSSSEKYLATPSCETAWRCTPFACAPRRSRR